MCLFVEFWFFCLECIGECLICCLVYWYWWLYGRVGLIVWLYEVDWYG